MMSFHLLIIFLFFYLILINFLFKKFSFAIDRISFNENHKLLLRDKNNIPLTGSFYLFFIIFFLFFNKENILIIFCALIFALGFLADLKILSSYKKRLVIQFSIISLFFFLNKDIYIITNLAFIDIFMNNELMRILLCTFFFMVLINGFNLIDGTNCLCVLNFLQISVFTYFLLEVENIDYFNSEIKLIIFSLLIFLSFNFFGKNFLGDGAAYGFGFFIGYILLKISLLSSSISPYFVANLLWYPAFENFFSILRRNIYKKNNYLPDNDHLHQLLFIVFNSRFIDKARLSSFIGISINSVLFIGYFIGYKFYNHTLIQIAIILLGITVYLLIYYLLNQSLKFKTR